MRVRPRLWPWLKGAFFDIGVISLALVLIYFFWNNYPLWISIIPILLCFICIGARQHAIGVLAHDGAHKLICSNKFINDLLTSLCFWSLGITISGFRRFHFKHHRTVGTLDDPELKHKNHFLLGQWQPPFSWPKLILQFIGDMVGGAIPHVIMAISLNRPVSILDGMGPLLWISFWTLISWYFGFLWIPIVWFLCIYSSFWAVFRIRLWTEHVGTLETHIITVNWWQKFLFLPHNIWHHWHHHKNPSIPFWALQEISAPTPGKTIGELFRELSGHV